MLESAARRFEALRFDMRLTLIVPGLIARSPAALAAAPALQRYARHMNDAAVDRDGIAHASLAALGLPRDTPVAPLLALGAGLDAGADYVLAATPVTLIAGRDDVVLAGAVTDLDPAETAALMKPLRELFAGDALTFAAPRADAWFARTPGSPALVTTALDAALGKPIFAHLPAGPDGKAWQRWQQEIQMLLFEHPVNLAREQRGAAPVTGLWFWGGGRRAGVAVPPGVVALACDGAAGDLARGIAHHGGQTDAGLPASFEAMLAQCRGADTALAALPLLADDDGLAAIATGWIAPATAALERGELTALDLVADGNGVAARWRAQRGSTLGRLASRWRGARFAVPVADDE